MAPKYSNSNHHKLVIRYFWRLARHCLVIGAWLLVITPSVHAEDMESDSYKIRMGNFNMTSGFKSSTGYSLTDTVGQTAAEFFTGTGYHVKAGFQYIYTLYDFSFTISSLLADLGPLTPGSFSNTSQTLTVSAPGQGYSVSAIASYPLTNALGDTIIDTDCNAGCSESSAGVWDDPSEIGFGYNVNGGDAATDFDDLTFFRRFPDASAPESPETIITTVSAGQNRTSTVTYQVSIPASQASGTYSTQITYIATPVY